MKVKTKADKYRGLGFRFFILGLLNFLGLILCCSYPTIQSIAERWPVIPFILAALARASFLLMLLFLSASLHAAEVEHIG